jgi:hypothetical protein
MGAWRGLAKHRRSSTCVTYIAHEIHGPRSNVHEQTYDRAYGAEIRHDMAHEKVNGHLELGQ